MSSLVFAASDVFIIIRLFFIVRSPIHCEAPDEKSNHDEKRNHHLRDPKEHIRPRDHFIRWIYGKEAVNGPVADPPTRANVDAGVFMTDRAVDQAKDLQAAGKDQRNRKNDHTKPAEIRKEAAAIEREPRGEP